jgi:Uma2 family endonuclease
MALPETLHRLSEVEYLDLERAAEFKSEFFEGEMFAMAGGTLLHSLIATNVAGEFRNKLHGSQCVPFNSDLRLKVLLSGLYTYPDVSVICGSPQLVEGTEDTVTNPTVLVEVLSDSTEAYDRGRKFEHYRQIPSLREYLLVSQKEPRIEQFIRQPADRWLLNEASGLDAKLELPALGVTVSLAEIFRNVVFAPVPLRAQAPPR